MGEIIATSASCGEKLDEIINIKCSNTFLGTQKNDKPKSIKFCFDMTANWKADKY